MAEAKVDWGDGWVQVREFRKADLVVLGFEEVGPEAHRRHLRRLATVGEIAREAINPPLKK